MKLNNLNRHVQKGFITLLMVCLLMAFPAWAQTAGDFDLSWSTIDGGGGTSSGGDFTLRGTIGQPDAEFMVGGDYELIGGFWSGVPVCIVDLAHFARFAEHWLEMDCDDLNNWCNGADLNHLDDVDSVDLGLLADEWLGYCPVGWPLK